MAEEEEMIKRIKVEDGWFENTPFELIFAWCRGKFWDPAFWKKELHGRR